MSKLNYIFVSLSLLCLPALASAQYFQAGGIAYTVLSATEHTVEVAPLNNGYRGSVNIPSVVTYGGVTYDVVALGKDAFYGSTVSSVAIPSSVTRIKNGCFWSSNGPATINLPASVLEIEELALTANNLSAIQVDEGNPNYRSIDGMLFSKDTTTIFSCPTTKSGVLTLPTITRHIAPSAFMLCSNIVGVALPEGLRSIGRSAFGDNRQLNNVVIPASVSHIGANPFAGCTALNSLSVAEGNANYYMDGMMIYSAGGDTLASAHKSADSVFLPATLRVVNGFGANRDVRYVRVPDGATTIGREAFQSSSLVGIDLPSNMETIGDNAFYYCTQLTRVGMPTSLGAMGNSCFCLCQRLTSVDIPNGMRIIPNSAFNSCSSLSRITWGNAVEEIGEFAFPGCAFSELRLPPTLRIVRTSAFAKYGGGANLRRVEFTAPLDTVEAFVFVYQHIEMMRFKNDTPPVAVATTDGGVDYDFLYWAEVDSMAIPCGSLGTWQADSYWGQFADKYHEDCSGIESAEECKLDVFPNPATDRITIQAPDGLRSAELLNALGQPVLFSAGDGDKAVLEVGGLARGLYMLRVKLMDGMATRKVVLQ